MKYFINYRKAYLGNLYINIILLMLFFVVGLCVLNACQKEDSSWESLNSKKTGTILLAYVDNSEVIYEGKNGLLKGEGMDALNQFITNTENLHHVTITPQIEKFNSSQEVLNRIRFSNGGVFGLGIEATTDDCFYSIDFPANVLKQNGEEVYHHKIVLKASSDWVPRLTSYINAKKSHKNVNSLDKNNYKEGEVMLGEGSSL